MSFDAFLKCDGINGDSTDSAHAQWMEVESYSHGLSQALGGNISAQGAITGGRVDAQDFSIVKRLDTATAKLSEYACAGKVIPNVVLQLHRATGQKQQFMEYTFKSAVISGLQNMGSSSTEDPVPMEEVSFRFAAFKIKYTITKADGTTAGDVPFGWDLEQNCPI